ncbi:MAG: hypothetical protein M0Z41_13040 [Peptococcaceae bacterium]|jgi:hypothetical protein|nr:hypothetical protein [Peptococcaceae bacterium]
MSKAMGIRAAVSVSSSKQRVGLLITALVLVVAGAAVLWHRHGLERQAVPAPFPAKPQVQAAHWIIFEKDHNLFLVNNPDGSPVPLTSSGDAGSFVFSSSTNSAFYVRSTEPSQPGQVEEIDLISKQRKLVSEKKYFMLTVNPTGHLLLGMEGTTPPHFDNWGVISAVKPVANRLPKDIASLAWSPDGRNLIYVPGQSDVSLRSLYLYNLDNGRKKTVLSNLTGPAGIYNATQKGGTAAAWASDGQSIFYGLSYWNNTAANALSSKNGIYRYDLRTGASNELDATPGQSVYMLHCLGDGSLVYAAGPAYPPPSASTVRLAFWRLPPDTSKPVYLFSLSTHWNDGLPLSWLPDSKAILYYKDGEVWSVPPEPGAHSSPVNGSSGATYFSGGGDEGDLTTVLLVNPDNTRFSPGPSVPVPSGGEQTGPPAPTPPPVEVQVSLSPDGSMVVSGQAGLTALINRLPYGDFIILPDRVVAGEYFPLSHPMTNLADLNGKAATGSFPGDAVTAEHAIPGGESAGTNLVPIKNTNVFLWVPSLDINGMLPTGHYLLYVGRSYGDPIVGHFEWLTVSQPVNYLSFLKQALVLFSGTS